MESWPESNVRKREWLSLEDAYKGSATRIFGHCEPGYQVTSKVTQVH
jgi:hypothetical protein